MQDSYLKYELIKIYYLFGLKICALNYYYRYNIFLVLYSESMCLKLSMLISIFIHNPQSHRLSFLVIHKLLKHQTN